MRTELSAALAEQVLAAIEEGLVVFDRRDRVRYRNRAFSTLWGNDEQMTSAVDVAGIVEGIRAVTMNREGLDGLAAHVTESTQPRSLDLHLDGDRFVELAMQPLVQRGRARGRVWRFRDVTAQKRSELAMLHAQKLESLGVLAGGIAHDFNNLLSSILGHSELGLAELDEGSSVSESFQAIGKAAERASELTQQMLAYAGKGTVLVEPVDLSQLVDEVADLIKVSIADGVTVHLDLTDDLPAIIADATQIRQVVMNLLLNAAEAIEGTGRVSVTTGVHHVGEDRIRAAHHAQETAEGEFVFLDVVDNGKGMDTETLARVFDPFFSTKFTGRGLGLAAVLGIVRGHRGLLEVRSRPQSGSAFTVHLPRGYEPTDQS